MFKLSLLTIKGQRQHRDIRPAAEIQNHMSLLHLDVIDTGVSLQEEAGRNNHSAMSLLLASGAPIFHDVVFVALTSGYTNKIRVFQELIDHGWDINSPT